MSCCFLVKNINIFTLKRGSAFFCAKNKKWERKKGASEKASRKKWNKHEKAAPHLRRGYALCSFIF
jgi:hypothetical protein